MRINTASSGGLKKIETDRKIAGLLIIKNGLAAGDFSTETVDIQLQRKSGGNINLYDDEVIKDIAEAHTLGEGFRRIKQTAYAGLSNVSSTAYIPLTNGGNYDMQEGEKFVIDFKDSLTSLDYHVIGVEVPGETTSTLLKCTNVDLDGTDKERTFEFMANSLKLAVPFANFKEIELTDYNGNTANRDKLEAVALMDNINDIVSHDYDADTTVLGASTQIVLGLVPYKKGRLTVTGATRVYHYFYVNAG